MAKLCEMAALFLSKERVLLGWLLAIFLTLPRSLYDWGELISGHQMVTLKARSASSSSILLRSGRRSSLVGVQQPAKFSTTRLGTTTDQDKLWHGYKYGLDSDMVDFDQKDSNVFWVTGIGVLKVEFLKKRKAKMMSCSAAKYCHQIPSYVWSSAICPGRIWFHVSLSLEW